MAHQTAGAGQEELARVTASPPRRVIGAGSMALLGVLLLYVALATPPASLLWLMFLLGLGGFAIWFSTRLWAATAHALVLTPEALCDSDGTLIARLDDIEKVDRSMFAMKPSNGFLVILKTRQARAWRPGLWWRMGRRVAVGGVTAASQTKPFADVLMATLDKARGSG